MTESTHPSSAALDASSLSRVGRRIIRRPGWAVLAALAVVTVVASIWIWRSSSPSPPAVATAPLSPGNVVILDETRQADAGISLEAVQAMSRTDIEEAPAVLTLDETRTARIGSMVDGIVVEAQAGIGSRVVAGQVLGAIHSHVIYDSWADYRKAVAEERRMETELDYATRAEGRALRLYQAKAISSQQLERAKADRVSAQEQLDIAKSEVRRSVDDLDHYGLVAGGDPTLEAGEKIPIRTPLAGVVLDRSVTPGTAVTTGTAMFVVSDLSNLWAVAEIDETRLSQIAVDHTVVVRVSAYPGESFSGTISFIGDTINPKTRRVTVRSTVPNVDGRLKPEMFATVELGKGEPRSILAVAAEAVQEIEGRSIVFVADGADTFRPRDVVLGERVDGWVEVREGVSAGETVVTAGSFLLKSELLQHESPDANESD